MAIKSVVARQDVREFSESISGKLNKDRLQEYIKFRLENIAELTADALWLIDHWIESLKIGLSMPGEETLPFNS